MSLESGCRDGVGVEVLLRRHVHFSTMAVVMASRATFSMVNGVLVNGMGAMVAAIVAVMVSVMVTVAVAMDDRNKHDLAYESLPRNR